MVTKDMQVKNLRPYENNPRINDGAVDAVAESIREFGFKVPIVVDEDNVIVAGHTRWKAAKTLKLKTVPVVVADDLTPEQIKAFRLADNKTAELAEWDLDLLDLELGDIEMDMEPFGFGPKEKKVIEDDYVPILEENPTAQRGDIYQLGTHRLMCGDSTSLDDVQMLVGGGTNRHAPYRSTLQC